MSSAPHDPPDPISALALRQVVTRLVFPALPSGSFRTAVSFVPSLFRLLYGCRIRRRGPLRKVKTCYLRPRAETGFDCGTGVLTFIVTWYVLTLSDTARMELRTPSGCRFLDEIFICPPRTSVVMDDRTCL